ncbi:MAG TPA: sulfurtransferase TusA family protein [Methylovorus sp.]|jgi:tRNA 2-thiouridine synthesizing protein A|nr:sulfurtransferase TusA family protein [Methylovorus sp.]
MEFTKELDARGLKCPLPILRCKKGLAELEPGQILKVLATDPGSVKDFQAFCKQTGHEMLALQEPDETMQDKVFTFHIRKRAS